jgi:hypothetical protein
MTKGEIRNLYAKARTNRLFAGEAVAKAAHAIADGNEAGFAAHMAEAERLARLAGSREKEAREAAQNNCS